MPAFAPAPVVPEAESDAEVGSLLTGPWQVELRGVLMDSHSSNCPGLVITKFLDGFGVPQTRNQDIERSRRHGLYASPQYLGGRQMMLDVLAVGSDLDELMAQKATLGYAWAPIADTDNDYVIPMAFTLAQTSDAFVVWGKPMRATWAYHLLAKTYELEPSQFADAAVCEFLATDPRIYSLAWQSQTMGVGSTSGGHGWPHGWPHGWGTSTPGSAGVVNGGNFPTYPRITIRANGGTFSNPSLENVTTGETWTIAITLAAGEYLVVDFAEQVARLNGSASRNNLVVRPPSSWWALASGANTVRLSGTGATGTATVEWRDAWMI